MKGTELKNYESPVTRRTQVMLESGICAASANPENLSTGKFGGIKGQSVNTDFVSDSDFTNSGWDLPETE